ncbi:MAG: AAA family ATPase [Nitrososphaerota archaeon]|nr:AAA family ATPase [Nitrososphaerota archaeon]MDG7005570.1 AAA family ATPase [Nitrososphaerota archaeon]
MSYVPVGVKGVDPLLDGKGIPRGSSVLLLGAPGSGKTIFSLQFLQAGVAAGEAGVYLSMDEDPERLLANAKQMGVDLTRPVKDGKLALVDASPIRLLPAKIKLGGAEVGGREFAVSTLVSSLTDAVKKVGATRLVVDPISTLIVHFSDEYTRRIAFLDLIAAASKTKCTTIFVDELNDAQLQRTHVFEEFLTQGVIVMSKILTGSAFTRVFSVEKMRGIANDTQPHPYKITEQGLEVFPTEQIF